MLRRSSTPEEEPRPRPPRPERHRPGSAYVELDVHSESAPETIGRYYIDLQKRHRARSRWDAPELRPQQTEVEVALLEELVGKGSVNFWDFPYDHETPDGALWHDRNTNLAEGFEAFVLGMGLEVKVVEVPPDPSV